MFGGKEKSNNIGNSLAGGPGAGLNSLVKDTHIEGSIKTASDIRIEGVLLGDLDCQAKLIIGVSGQVIGKVSCRTAMIEGKFEGTLEVTELLELRETAEIMGDISCGKLKIDPGAELSGNVSMGAEKRSIKAAPAPASNGKIPVLA